MTTITSKPIMRFPRLLEGDDAAILSELLWFEPEVKIGLKEDRPSILFTFRIDASTEFPRHRRLANRELFGHWKGPIELRLEKSYQNAQFNRKPVKGIIANLLRQVIKDAIRTWLDDSWDLGDWYRAEKNKHLAIFDQESRTKSGPQPNGRIALSVAKLWAERTKAANTLRAKLKIAHRKMKDAALIREIENSGFRYESIREALQNIFAEQSNISPRQFFTPDITPRDIVKALFEVELKKQGLDTAKVSVEAYRRLGKNLHKRLSKLKSNVEKE